MLLTAALNRGPEDEEGARASGRILRAIRTEMMGPLNKGVLHTSYVLATKNASMQDSNYHSK